MELNDLISGLQCLTSRIETLVSEIRSEIPRVLDLFKRLALEILAEPSLCSFPPSPPVER